MSALSTFSEIRPL